MAIKAMHHVCIQTEDYKASMAFYTDILGFEVVEETANFHGRDYNTWLRLNDFLIELQTPKKGTTFNAWSNLNAGPVHLAFLVDDVDESYAAFKTKGFDRFKLKDGEVIYQVFDSRLFKLYAPEGTEIEFRDVAEL